MTTNESTAPKTYTEEEVKKYIADTETATKAQIESSKAELLKQASVLKSMGAASIATQALHKEVSELLPAVTDENNKKHLQTFLSEYDENKKLDADYPVVSEAIRTITQMTIQNENLKKRAASGAPADDTTSKKAKGNDSNPVIPPADAAAKEAAKKPKGLLDESTSRLTELSKKYKSEIEGTTIISTTTGQSTWVAKKAPGS